MIWMLTIAGDGSADLINAIGPLSAVAVLGLLITGVFVLKRELTAEREQTVFWRQMALNQLEGQGEVVKSVAVMADQVATIARVTKAIADKVGAA